MWFLLPPSLYLIQSNGIKDNIDKYDNVFHFCSSCFRDISQNENEWENVIWSFHSSIYFFLLCCLALLFRARRAWNASVLNVYVKGHHEFELGEECISSQERWKEKKRKIFIAFIKGTTGKDWRISIKPPEESNADERWNLRFLRSIAIPSTRRKTENEEDETDRSLIKMDCFRLVNVMLWMDCR